MIILYIIFYIIGFFLSYIMVKRRIVSDGVDDNQKLCKYWTRSDVVWTIIVALVGNWLVLLFFLTVFIFDSSWWDKEIKA